MSQPGAPSRVVLALLWLFLGLAMVGVAGWLGWTRWSAILSGHPAMLAAGIACGLIGFVAIAWSVATLIVGGRQDRGGGDDRPARRTRAQLLRRARWRIVFAVPALVLCAVLVGALAWARPLGATAAATTALESRDDVRISERLTWYELVPVKQNRQGKAIKPTSGLIFIPGARVDARAYAATLRPLAEQGYFVAVLKEPFGVALIERDHAETVLDVHPEIAHWAVGGHSLGGVAAASFADDHPRVSGLVLYAAYPADAVRRADLKVLSLSGSDDGLTTPADIEQHKSMLPPSTSYIVLPGAVHSDFGDYGAQPGDNLATADHAAIQAQIATSTAALLASLTPPAPKK